MLPGRFVGFTASDPLCLPFDCPVALLLLSSYICTLVLRYEGTYIHTWYLMNVGVYPGTGTGYSGGACGTHWYCAHACVGMKSVQCLPPKKMEALF